MDKELLQKLCVEYSFKWDIVGAYIRIISKRRDTYYILNIDYEDHQIKLYHANEYENAGMHKHGSHNNLECVMKSIRSHDEIYLPHSRHNKYERLMIIFDQMYIARI